MHDRLLASPDALTPPDLLRHAGELGLDVDRFARSCAAAQLRARASPRTSQSADASGVSGTPTFFVNGRRHQGVYDVDILTREIKAAVRGRRRDDAGPRRGGPGLTPRGDRGALGRPAFGPSALVASPRW